MPTPSRKKIAAKSRASLIQQPVSKQPVSKQPVSKKPISKKPVSKKPVSKQPVSKKPVGDPPSGVVAVGAKAPDFTLADSGGTTHHLAELRGSQVVLYFYPKDDTSDCTAQACAFETKRALLKRRGVALLAVSPDPAKTHVKFATKHSLHFPLLVDDRDSNGTPRVCSSYGVWHEKSMYGNRYMGVIRTTYLIGPDGRVMKRWDRVKVDGHIDDVMAALND